MLKVRWSRWALAAAAVAAIALCGVVVTSHPVSHVAQVAWRELNAGSQIDFHSSDAGQIRAWVKDHAGLNVPLANGHSVQFIGASLLHDSDCTVCISFHADNGIGKLVIARGGSEGPTHPSVRRISYKGARIVSWVAGGQTYAVASLPVENAHAACALCHMDRSVAGRA